MKAAIVFLISCVSVFAGWREDCPIKDDFRRAQDWYQSDSTVTQSVASIASNGTTEIKVAFFTRAQIYEGQIEPIPVVTSTVTTNITANPCYPAESYLDSLWKNVGGSVTNAFEQNMYLLKGAASMAATTEDKDLLRDLALEIIAVYAKAKAEGCQFTLIPATTNIVTETNVTWKARQ
jgi:hypothetical protein